MPNHRIEFHYLVEVEPETVPITTCEEEHRYPCVWLPLDSLADYPLKPEFLVHDCRSGTENSNTWQPTNRVFWRVNAQTGSVFFIW